MRIHKKIGYMTIAAAGILLAACSHHSNQPSNDYQTAQNANWDNNSDNTGAQTYGINGGQGYQQQAQARQQQLARRSASARSMPVAANQTYYFAFDSNAIKSSDINSLNAQADYLASHPNARIRLEGNTDNRGSREYNVGLGWRRDQSVAHYLEQRGVLPKQIQMVSYGKEHPVAFGNNPKSWALNRRVNMIYKVKS